MRLLKLKFLDVFQDEVSFYPTPLNINYFWNFGSLAGIFLGIQIVTGLFLSMHYDPSTAQAFASVEHIMRDVNFGWALRYLHANGASFFFIFIYMHVGRGLYYRSYISNFAAWAVGVLIFLLSMATAFLGYVLPWGQMSFWGATVITNLFSAIPFVGKTTSYLLWGGFSVGNPTLNRFFSLHFALPFILLALVLMHLLLLHKRGSSSPLTAKSADKVNFFFYFYIKDLFSLFVVMACYFFLVFFEPNLLGHPDNYIEANPLVTPPHIVPEWYFLPFYAILRSIPSKLGGVVFMFLAIFVFFFANVLEDGLHYIRRRPIARRRMGSSLSTYVDPKFLVFHKVKVFLFFFIFIALGWVGAMPAENPYVARGAYLTLFYFAYLLFSLWVINYYEEFALLFQQYEGVRVFKKKPPTKRPIPNPKYERAAAFIKKEWNDFVDILFGRF